jgi:phytoene synthase
MQHLPLTHPDYAARLTARSGTNFFYSFSLLPRDEREAMNTVYAFCRTIDDLVDENVDDDVSRKRERLDLWRGEVEKCYRGESRHPILLPLSKVVQRFRIPQQYFLTLIDGMEMDLVKHRYATFEELREYCYSVAGVVGLMCIEIFGYKYDETKEYAVNLGIALQLTNILRDVKADKAMGRIYFPHEDLELFGVSEDDIEREHNTPRLTRMLQFEAERARSYYTEARRLLRPDERRTMAAAEIMDAIYFRLLEKIEASDFDVFNRRISVSAPHKLLIALRFWTGTHLRRWR